MGESLRTASDKPTVSDVVMMVEVKLRRAGRWLRASVAPTNLRALAGSVNSWPDIRYERADYAAWKKELPKMRGLNAAQVSELDEVLGWLWSVPADRRGIVFSRMLNIPYRKIASMEGQGRGHATIIRDYERGLADIVAELVAQEQVVKKRA